VSPKIRIYFYAMVPLTLITLGIWWFANQHSSRVLERDIVAAEARLNRLEARVMGMVRKKTGIRVQTMNSENGSTRDGCCFMV